MLGGHSGFMRLKDPEMRIKRYKQQKMWFHSFSRWINIWIIFPRCNRPGLKTYHASLARGQHGEADPKGSERQLSAQQLTVGTILCRGVEAGTSQASGARDSALHQPREPPRVPPPSQSPDAWRKKKEMCLVLSTRWLLFR